MGMARGLGEGGEIAIPLDENAEGEVLVEPLYVLISDKCFYIKINRNIYCLWYKK